MKAVQACVLVLITVLFLGCQTDTGLVPDQEQTVTESTPAAPLGKITCGRQDLYTLYTSADFPNYGFTELERIDTRTGVGSYVWSLGVPPDPSGQTVCPFGLAFDLDGSMYVIVSYSFFNAVEGDQRSRLAHVDAKTGATEFIGESIPMHFAGPDIDAKGVMYATGFTVGAPEGGPNYLFGDSYLYRFNKKTGVATRVGNTGRTDWMDLAFDSHGRLWATTDNKLYILNPKTGAATFMRKIIGVPQSGIPNVDPADFGWMEVMTIAFDEDDVLWATTMKGFSNDFGNGTVLKINVNTGLAKLVGYTGKAFNHGGDMMPARVRIQHKGRHGRFEEMVIAMDDLPVHRAHGDRVPGVDD